MVAAAGPAHLRAGDGAAGGEEADARGSGVEAEVDATRGMASAWQVWACVRSAKRGGNWNHETHGIHENVRWGEVSPPMTLMGANNDLKSGEPPQNSHGRIETAEQRATAVRETQLSTVKT